jgi:hypothetical protein
MAKKDDSEIPLIEGSFLMEKFPGKGGRTYIALPEIMPNKNNASGRIRVKGTIDGFAIKQYHLMPSRNGQLFMPIKTIIRKSIKKQMGDWVKVVLYPDISMVEVPEELLVCFRMDDSVYQKFLRSSEGLKKEIIDWIYEVKTDTTKVNRIAKAMERISKMPDRKRAKT